MTDQGKKYMSDILYAVELIEQFINTVNHFKEFQNDLKTQSAVEWQLSIIGEAVTRYSNRFPEKPLNHSEKIREFRNRLIHTYDNVDPAMIWAIIKNQLDPLKVEIIEKLKE
jgi:uncharacterized protein with HEPN domain